MNPGRLRGSRLASLAALKYFFAKLLTVEVQSEVGGNIKQKLHTHTHTTFSFVLSFLNGPWRSHFHSSISILRPNPRKPPCWFCTQPTRAGSSDPARWERTRDSNLATAQPQTQHLPADEDLRRSEPGFRDVGAAEQNSWSTTLRKARPKGGSEAPTELGELCLDGTFLSSSPPPPEGLGSAIQDGVVESSWAGDESGGLEAARPLHHQHRRPHGPSRFVHFLP